MRSFAAAQAMARRERPRPPSLRPPSLWPCDNVHPSRVVNALAARRSMIAMTTPHPTRPNEPARPGTGHDGAPAYGYAEEQAAAPSGFGPNFARASWPAFMAAGLGAVALGIVLLVWPKATLAIAAILI